MRPQFQPSQAREIAQAFEEHGVDYLFIGKGGAVLLGFPAMTQDIDVFPERSEENGARIVAALRKIGFELDADRQPILPGNAGWKVDLSVPGGRSKPQLLIATSANS